MVFDIPFLAFIPADSSLDRNPVFSGSSVAPGETLNDVVTPPNPVSWFYYISRIHCLVGDPSLPTYLRTPKYSFI